MCGLSNIKYEVDDLQRSLHADIVVINETKLKKDIKIPNSDLIWTFSHEPISSCGSTQGGLAVGIAPHLRDNIQVSKLDIEIPTILVGSPLCNIFCTYIAPMRWSDAQFQEWLLWILDFSRTSNKSFMIIGDLNARIGSLVQDSSINSRGRLLLDQIDKGLLQVGGSLESWCRPTFIRGQQSSVIDLCLVSKSAADLIQRLQIGYPSNSDHAPVVVEVLSSRRNITKIDSLPSFNSKAMKNKRKQQKFQETFSAYYNFLLDLFEDDEFNVDLRWLSIVFAIRSAACTSFGYSGKKQKCDVWNEELQSLSNRRRRLGHLVSRLVSAGKFDDDLREAQASILLISEDIKHLIKSRRNAKWEAFIQRLDSSTTSSKHSNISKMLSGLKGGLPSINKVGDTRSMEDAIADHFKQIYDSALNNHRQDAQSYYPFIQFNIPSSVPDNFDAVFNIDWEIEVSKNVKRLASGKAPGFDKVPAELFKFGGILWSV